MPKVEIGEFESNSSNHLLMALRKDRSGGGVANLARSHLHILKTGKLTALNPLNTWL
jgi:hypothetical protein